MNPRAHDEGPQLGGPCMYVRIAIEGDPVIRLDCQHASEEARLLVSLDRPETPAVIARAVAAAIAAMRARVESFEPGDLGSWKRAA